MDITVYATYDDVQENKIPGNLVVVVDVFRATSTIITSLNNGCKGIIPVVEIEEAMALYKNGEKGEYLLGGEREALKIEGFHLSNSPNEYTRNVVEGRMIIFTTTNGTKAIRKAEGADEIILGALINAEAIAQYILSKGEDVVFICAGTEGQFSLDDIVTVGAIISRIAAHDISLELDDLGFVCRYMYDSYSDNLESVIKNCRHYNILKEAGYYDDITYCLKEDVISIVPRYVDGIITAK